MRTYLILKEKVAEFNADAEIQALLGGARRAARGGRGSSSRRLAKTIKDEQFDLPRCAIRATRTSVWIS
jgi:hypothetical protein